MNHSILITDNDPSITSIFEFMLVQNGFECHKSSSISESLHIIQDIPSIDLAFLDFKLHYSHNKSGLNDFLDIQPNLPIFIMMNSPNDRELKVAMNLDAYGIIYKPFDINEILSLIKESLEIIKP